MWCVKEHFFVVPQSGSGEQGPCSGNVSTQPIDKFLDVTLAHTYLNVKFLDVTLAHRYLNVKFLDVTLAHKYHINKVMLPWFIHIT